MVAQEAVIQEVAVLEVLYQQDRQVHPGAVSVQAELPVITLQGLQLLIQMSQQGHQLHVQPVLAVLRHVLPVGQRILQRQSEIRPEAKIMG